MIDKIKYDDKLTHIDLVDKINELVDVVNQLKEELSKPMMFLSIEKK